MKTITLTPVERDAIVQLVDLALSDQEHYLRYGQPEIDYPGEWADVALNKAEAFEHAADVMEKFRLPTIANDLKKTAKNFREAAEAYRKQEEATK